ncbi:MAG: hypothetical protein VB960_06620 [Pseudohongiellaceae bacterium]
MDHGIVSAQSREDRAAAPGILPLPAAAARHRKIAHHREIHVTGLSETRLRAHVLHSQYSALAFAPFLPGPGCSLGRLILNLTREY